MCISRNGSSPRMRGKPHLLVDRAAEARIIPAHAGQTSLSRLASSAATDHPRACGANRLERLGSLVAFGSSPRMRGKRRLVREQHHRIRIIPAHAGQTSSVAPKRVDCPDHPRACGANPKGTTRVELRIGSSPRMRGKRRRQAAVRQADRIIPAHAGQTAAWATR